MVLPHRNIVFLLEFFIGALHLYRTLMKRIFFVCVEGFAKAKMDGGGFSLRLRTETENLFCFKFLEHGFSEHRFG